LVVPAITALQGLDHKYVSILPLSLTRDWTQTDSDLKLIVQFVLACRRPWAMWYSKPDDFQQVPLTIEILKILENEFSEPQIKKSELARTMDRAARASCWASISASVGRMRTKTSKLRIKRMKLRLRLRLRLKLCAKSATRPELSRRP
jgi:hypothetical protein